MSDQIDRYNKTGNGWTILVYILMLSLFFINSCGEKKSKIYRIGVLSGSGAFIHVTDGFKEKMAQLGYTEGRNIVYDVYNMDANKAGEKEIAEKFVKDKVDLIFAFPTETAMAAITAVKGTGIPVVFANVGIEGLNLVKSVREPGGNITGVRFPAPELTVKRFELLMELAPGIKRLWATYDRNYPLIGPTLDVLRPIVAARGVKLIEVPVDSIDDIRADLLARAKSTDIGIDAIQMLPDLLTRSPACLAVITKFADDHKLPVAGGSPFTVDKGAVFSYAITSPEVGKMAAPLVDKIFKGTPAGTIPIVTPEAQLRLNYRQAQKLGLKVPEGILKMANEVIR